MKPIHIFKAGSHTSAAGDTLDFTVEQLQEAADAYDPKLHEAPIVVGHPKDNGPAFGWISGLSFADGNLHAIPDQVNSDFEEMVGAGSYKKVSASLYTPDSPANPVPGKYYVRHVGFLGAMPPAIKGLEAIEFSEDEGVVEFSADWEVAGVFRRLREFLIEKFGVEEADKAIPGYMVEATEDSARNPKTPMADESLAYYSENEDVPMNEAELQAAADKLAEDQAAHETAVASFNEQVAATAVEAETARVASIHARVDALVAEGKVLPADADGIKSFAEKLDVESVVEFGEGEVATKESSVDFYFANLAKATVPVDFGEHSKDDGEGDKPVTAEALAAKAVEFRESEAKAGRTISITQAMTQITGLGD